MDRIPKRKWELISNEKKRYGIFQKRRKCLEKKAYELSTLCGVEACIIVYGPKLQDHCPTHDQPQIWPKDPDAIPRIFTSYKKQSDENRCKRTLDLSDFLGDRKKKAQSSVVHMSKKNDETKYYPTWDYRYNNLSVEQLRAFDSILEEKLEAAKTRFQFLKGNYPKMPDNSSIYDGWFSCYTSNPPQNHSHSMQLKPIHEPFLNQHDLGMPIHYPPFDLSLPNSMMNMDDIDCIEFDGASGDSNVSYSSTTPTNIPFFYDPVCGIVENVNTDYFRAQTCYYAPTMQSMLPSMPNLMMDDRDCIELGGDFGRNVTYNMDDKDFFGLGCYFGRNVTYNMDDKDFFGLGCDFGTNVTYNTDPLYDPISGVVLDNVTMDNIPMPSPISYYGGPNMEYLMISSIPSYMPASFLSDRS